VYGEESRLASRSATGRRFVPGILLALVGVCLAAVWFHKPASEAKSPDFVPQTQSATATQQTVIGKDCQQCHRLIVQTFQLDAHGKSARFLSDTRGAKCEACHGNSDKHAETSTKTKFAPGTINPAAVTAAEANQTCLVCHRRERTHREWIGGQHDRRDMSCLSCHSVHHTKLIQRMSLNLNERSETEVAEILSGRLPLHMLAGANIEETCLGCHVEQRKALFQRSTHLFRTELRNMKVGCTSCHNPHGGEAGRMLANHTINDVCYTCHAEKRGPFLWDHPPVRENCMNCHRPHGSSNPKLLTERVHLMCQQCHIHMLPRHSTTAGKPLDIFSFNRGCLNCHGQVHGSNHPGGRTFGR
jgi:predicted CXXCH cytochrome family protein